MAAAHATVLVVDDEPDISALYALTLLRQGYQVETAESLQQAREQLQRKHFDLVITDMRLPDGTGLSLLRELARQGRSERCIVMTAYGSTENAVQALKCGAYDYLTKPVDIKQLREVVAAALQPPTQPSISPSGLLAPSDGRQEAHLVLNRLVGQSAAMAMVRERVLKVARSMAPVLICGESGTGKELVAQAIHACSQRAAGPFVAVNCGAIPETLLEAEFFGYKKGAFTGAVTDREGYFQAASGGTLFLDEIGDLPLAMQAKLLRVVQERVMRPLGSSQEDAVDVRIISATHKDLSAAVRDGLFRQDLYFRLNVIDIWMPPLRERRGDLPLLCETLIARIAADSGLPKPRLSEAALAQLMQHPLPGNVRQLENLLHRAMAMGDGLELALDLAPPERSLPTPPEQMGRASPGLAELPRDLQAHLDGIERHILVQALMQTGFNRTAAADLLGLTVRQIRYRIAQLGIESHDKGSLHEQ